VGLGFFLNKLPVDVFSRCVGDDVQRAVQGADEGCTVATLPLKGLADPLDHATTDLGCLKADARKNL